MKENEIFETKEALEVEEFEATEKIVENSLALGNVKSAMISPNQKTIRENYTTITDKKMIFNLENSCDFKINDCKGEKIRICDVLVKKFIKPLENPEIDEETGEVIKDKEVTMVTILVDDNKKSYVTKSKLFSYNVLRLLEVFPVEEIKKGLDIEICENSVKDSNNKSLGFIIL